MNVTKLRAVDENGLVPAGQYFARLADALRASNERAATVIEKADAQEHRLEARYRKARRATGRAHARQEHSALM